jgi:hypothetical protein
LCTVVSYFRILINNVCLLSNRYFYFFHLILINNNNTKISGEDKNLKWYKLQLLLNILNFLRWFLLNEMRSEDMVSSNLLRFFILVMPSCYFFSVASFFPISNPSVIQILVLDYVSDIMLVNDTNFQFLLSLYGYFSEKLGEVILTDICKMQIWTRF